MEITKQYSKLHEELQLEEYSIPFKDLDEITNKEEFLEYIEYFQIDKKYLLEQILDYKYLEFLHEYMKNDIISLLNKDRYHWLNDENLKYISNYVDIIELYAYNNPTITTVLPFAKTLKILNAGGNSGINDDGLKEAYNLKELYAYDNYKITTVQPFSKTLKILYASDNCGINDNGLLEASNLETLYAYDNPKITIIIEYGVHIRIQKNNNCSTICKYFKNIICKWQLWN